jgi:hypothetical protein
MISLLSAIGRVVIVIAAVLVIIGCVIGGYLFARYQELAFYGDFTIGAGGLITPREFLYSLLGGGIGFVVSGTVFGAIATLYDIRDNVRLIAERRSGPLHGDRVDPAATTRVRREPRVD